MKKLFVVLISLLTLNVYGQETPNYKIVIDLNGTENDQIPITIYPPPIDSQTVEYHLAKVVPGTYSVSDFGRFVTGFSATDPEGNELEVERLDTNRWKILDAARLFKIAYRVHDTWDTFDQYGEDPDQIIFEPGGTNIEKEREVYMLNTFGFIGYIKGMKFFPYEVEVKHPAHIFGSSALRKPITTDSSDTFQAEDFNFLADGPIMYAEPDTVSKQIANARVLVSVYSPNKLLSAQDVMDNITDLMLAQADFLGGKLPVDRYAFLIYLMDAPSLSGSFGALEHSYSSLYTLPEAGADRIAQTVRDVAAHEFFHIVTPLNIHSEEIGNFNYIEPEMSQHLWMYEGVTEYSSMLVQVKYDLYGLDKFFEEIQEKLTVADNFPNVSFTNMSENILEPEFQDMYVNVYYKGALIGMCLDIYLAKYSKGTYNLQMLMRDLAKKYGKSVSFKDEELFVTIEELTYPEIGEFLATYVGGDTPLPIAEVLSWVGIQYGETYTAQEPTIGQIGVGLVEGKITINNTSQMNEFGKDMGYMEGDEILSLNGQEITLATIQEIFEDYMANAKEGDKVEMVVSREVKPGKVKKKKLKSKVVIITKEQRHYLEPKEEPSEEEITLLKAWLSTEK